MIRRMIRRLETVPVVGRQVSRARPVVHGICRVLDPVIRWYYSAPARFRSGCARLRRRDLRIKVWWPLIRKGRALVSRYFLALWARMGRFRPLLNENPADLSVPQRAQRRMLSAFLALPNRHTRQALARFEQAIVGTQQATHGAGDRTGILMMIGSLGPGGSERQVVNTLLGLKAHSFGPVGLACNYLQTPTHQFFLPQLEAAGISVSEIGAAPVTAIDPAIAAAIATLPVDLHEVMAFAAMLVTQRPAIAHLWLDDINVKGGIAAVAVGVPRIVLSQRSLPPYNFLFHQPYMRECYRWMARQPQVTLVNNSQAGARSYEVWLDLSPGTIRVIHNGFQIDPEMLERYRVGRGAYRARLGICPDAPVVGVVLRMSEEKRPLLWLEIAAGIRRALPEARFLVVGDGPLWAEMNRRAEQPDLAGAVSFTGHDSNVLAAIADMDLFLLTSRAEGLPNILVEAQMVGIPVVTTPAGGAPETLVPGRTGFVLESADSEQAARLLVRLLQDTDWRAKAGRQAVAFVQSAFNIDRAVDELIAVYGTSLDDTNWNEK